MSIIDSTYVQQISGQTFSTTEQAIIEALIPAVQGEMETYLSRAVESRVFSMETAYQVINPNAGISQTYGSYQLVYVKNPPVSFVDSVYINGILVDPGMYAATTWGITYFGFGMEYLAATGVILGAYPINTFQLTYHGGLDGTNIPAMKLLLARAVLREFTESKEADAGRAGYTSMRVEDFSWKKSEAVVSGTYQRGVGKGGAGPAGPFLPSEQRLLDTWRRRMVAGG